MNKRKAQKAIQEVAKRNGVTEQEVVEEIEAAITQAYRASIQSHNQEAIALWERVPKAGEVPTAYELVAFLRKQVTYYS